MEKALVSLLKANNELVAAVKYISPMKREDYPSITYEITGRDEEIATNGKPVGLVRTPFIITVRAKTYKSAKEISKLVRVALSMPIINTTPKIYLSTLEDESESQLLDPDTTEVTINYTFHHAAD